MIYRLKKQEGINQQGIVTIHYNKWIGQLYTKVSEKELEIQIVRKPTETDFCLLSDGLLTDCGPSFSSSSGTLMWSLQQTLLMQQLCFQSLTLSETPVKPSPHGSEEPSPLCSLMTSTRFVFLCFTVEEIVSCRRHMHNIYHQFEAGVEMHAS